MNQASRLMQWMDGGEVQSSRVIAITGGKGGVGKSNLAVALGLTAASYGRKTVLVDGDLGLANVDVLLDFEAERDLSHLIAGEAELDDVLVEVPFGLRVLPGASGVSSLANLEESQRRRLSERLDELERVAELIIVDTGAGISRQVIDFCVGCGEVVVVTTPEPTAITDAYALIKVIRQRDPGAKLWVLVNMARTRLEGERTLERIDDVSRRFLDFRIRKAGYVLMDEAVSNSVRARRAFSLEEPASEAARCVREIAEQLGFDAPCRQAAPRQLLRRLATLFTGGELVTNEKS